MGSSRTTSEASKLLHFLELVTAAETPAAVLRAVQSYLNAWPKERVEAVQKIDGGWAPFDWNRQPLRVNGLRDLCRIRDAVHRHCIFLSDAGMATTPELTELDEFFCAAIDKAEKTKQAALQAHTQAIPAYQYVLDN